MSLILFLLLAVSCERKIELFEFNCDDCYREKPETGPLIIYFSFNHENDFVLYTIYQGNFEEGIVEYADTAFYKEEQIEVPVDEYYSVEAKYVSGADTIYVVDGDKFNLKREKNECDEKCYYFKGGIIDVRLKQ
ncbi:hypothetical protein [Maribellus sp. YY47]|uniref:hypothetical protein n=1 Tax=Maribellus sp. YY47 TaxID=2929486 RepID=UPI0020015567|nr:hypothetical protein [Maribellus sp. YY47]MCK3682483.1 hypothetical protein [Maribellus sp. YY47]